MFIRPGADALAGFVPDFTVLHAPEFQADPARHGTRTGTFIVLNFAQRMHPDRRHPLRRRAQEVDLHHHELPAARARRALDALLGQHRARRATRRCSSASPAPARPRSRPIPTARLIGDDEHGWSERGRVQLRGRLLRQGDQALARPASPRSTPPPRRFGTVLENVVVDPVTRCIDLDRPGHHREHPRVVPASTSSRTTCRAACGGHPSHIVFLTADAFGVLPPIAKLTRGAGDVLLPLRLHGEGGRHRARRDRAEGDVQRLLRRPVPPAASGRLRQAARRADREAPGQRLAASTPAGPAGRTAWATA